MLRLEIAPDLVNVLALGLLLYMLLLGAPCSDSEEAQHIHVVNLIHSPAAFKKRVVGGIYEIRQRQTSGVVS